MPEGQSKNNKFFTVSILFSIAVIAGGIIYYSGKIKTSENTKNQKQPETVNVEELVIPSAGIELPINWGSLGKKLIESGVIDEQKLQELYSSRGGLSAEMKDLLYTDKIQEIKMTKQNANLLLNIFWAFGLANKNDVLIYGPIADPKYGGTGNFASTGGWILSKGNSMNYFAKHSFVVLTDEEQKVVDRVSQNIYRPCCNNSTYFPDCNHGMAMLGLLELMAYNKVPEDKMYEIALNVNSYWFPDTYLTIAQYLKQNGISWAKVNPKEVLGMGFSSADGYRRVLTQIAPNNRNQSGSCGV